MAKFSRSLFVRLLPAVLAFSVLTGTVLFAHPPKASAAQQVVVIFKPCCQATCEGGSCTCFGAPCECSCVLGMPRCICGGSLYISENIDWCAPSR